MMDSYVRPWHIYSHSRTCTRSGLHIIPSILVAFHECYLLDCASIHEISTLMIWFKYISDIFIHYGDIDPLYISIYYGDLDSLYIFIHFGDSDLLYIVRGNDHTWHFVYHAYSWPLYSYVSGTSISIFNQMQRLIIVLYLWVAGSSTYVFITPLLGWIL